MSVEQKKLTLAIVANLKQDLKEFKLSTKDVINKASKLAQIASGFLIGEEGEIKYLKSSPKLDELIDLLLLEVQGKVIIFHNFVASGRMIEKRLKSKGIKFRSVRGETKNQPQQIDDFQHDPSIKALVSHPLSGGEGLNLQVANVVIFYDPIYAGATLRQQCIGRVYRKGQGKVCVIIDLQIQDPDSAVDSIDERILASALSKRDLAKSMLDWIRDF